MKTSLQPSAISGQPSGSGFSLLTKVGRRGSVDVIPIPVTLAGPHAGEWNSPATILKKSSEEDSFFNPAFAVVFRRLWSFVAGDFESPACDAAEPANLVTGLGREPCQAGS